MKHNKKIIDLIDNHLHEIYKTKSELIESLGEYPELIETHLAYRARIAHDNELQKGDSFSFSKEGLIFLLEGHTDRFQGEELDLDIFQANVTGYNLKKLILKLEEEGVFCSELAKLHKEDEILAIEIDNVVKIYEGSYWDFMENPRLKF